MLDRAWELARVLESGPPLVFAAIKEVVRESENLRANDALSRVGKRQFPTVDRLYDSEDQMEGFRAFAENANPCGRAASPRSVRSTDLEQFRMALLRSAKLGAAYKCFRGICLAQDPGPVWPRRAPDR